MWDERSVFVIAALAGISVWSYPLFRGWLKANRFPKALALLPIALVIIGALRSNFDIPDLRCDHWFSCRLDNSSVHEGASYRRISLPDIGDVFTFLTGCIFGILSAKFVATLFRKQNQTPEETSKKVSSAWGSFGRLIAEIPAFKSMTSNFTIRENVDRGDSPVKGILALCLLLLIYGLPVYYREVRSVFSTLGLSSATVKTPVGELTISGLNSVAPEAPGASVTSGEGQAAGIPHPNDPFPALNSLANVTSISSPMGWVNLDVGYIEVLTHRNIQSAAGFDIHGDDVSLNALSQLGKCLHAYVSIIPDNHLLFVDLRPVVESLFIYHASMITRVKEIKSNSMEPITLQRMQIDLQDLEGKSNEVMSAVIKKFKDAPPQSIRDSCPENQKRNEAVSRQSNFLLPYLTISLAQLLAVRGAADEGVAVLAEWVQSWTDVRGLCEGTPERGNAPDGANCEAQLKDLPEWFRFRAEFALDTILSSAGGHGTHAYRDFLKDLLDRYKNYLNENPIGINLLSANAVSCNLWAEKYFKWDHRNDRDDSEQSSPDVLPSTAIRLITVLTEDENKYLREEVAFLSEENDVAALEALYERGRVLAAVAPNCLSIKNKDATIADYMITSGLVALTVADRLDSIGFSASHRDRSVVLLKEAKRRFEEGRRDLLGAVRQEQADSGKNDLENRIFKSPTWERSNALASRAISELQKYSP